MTYHEHQVADGRGNGSRSALEDEKTGDLWSTKDSRAETQTTFWLRDINKLNVSRERKKRLKRMLRRQEGEHVNADGQQSRGQQNHEEWKRRVVTTYASQLGMTTAQKQRAEHLVLDVLDINSFGYYAVEEVALATLNVVAREDGWMIENNDRFQQQMVDVGMWKETPNWVDDDRRADMETLSSLRELVRERLDT